MSEMIKLHKPILINEIAAELAATWIDKSEGNMRAFEEALQTALQSEYERGLEEAAAYHDECAAKAKRRLQRERTRKHLEPSTIPIGDREMSFPGNHLNELIDALKEEIVGHEVDAKALRALKETAHG